MRRDFQLALIIAVAAIPAGFAVSEAVELFPYLKEHPGVGFCVSSGVTLLLLAIALVIAIRGEQEAERQGASKRMTPLVGMVISALAFIGFLGWYVWPHAQVAEGGKENTTHKESLMESIYFDCTAGVILPIRSTAPSTPFMYVVGNEVKLAYLGYAEFQNTVGDVLTWPDLKPPFALKLTIINYSSEPYFDLIIPVSAIVSDMHKFDNATRSYTDGQSPRVIEHLVLIKRIDPGPSNQITIYIYNQTKFFTEFRFPSEISVKNLGETEKHPVKVVFSDVLSERSSLFGQDSTGPLTSPLPTPAPPGKPKGK